MRLALLCLCGPLGGCLSLGLTPLPCEGDEGCPGGRACRDGVCAPAKGEGEGEGEGEGDACEIVFEDRFDAPIGTAWGRTGGDAFVDAEEGALVLRATGGGASGVVSPPLDLVGGAVEVEVIDPAESPRVFLSVSTPDDSEWAAFQIGEGEGLVARTSSWPGVDGPFGVVSHRHLRIREAGGDVLWEHSADGRAWVQLASRPAELDLTDARVRLGTSNGAELVAALDTLRVSRGECADTCVPSVEEEFTAALDPALWEASTSGGGRFSVLDGAFHMELTSNGPGDSIDLKSQTVTDVRGLSLTVGLRTPPALYAQQLLIAVYSGDDSSGSSGFAELVVFNDSVQLRAYVPGGVDEWLTFPVDAATLTAVRLRFGAAVRTELSTDGRVFTEVLSQAAPLGFLDDVGVSLGFNQYDEHAPGAIALERITIADDSCVP